MVDNLHLNLQQRAVIRQVHDWVNVDIKTVFILLIPNIVKRKLWSVVRDEFTLVKLLHWTQNREFDRAYFRNEILVMILQLDGRLQQFQLIWSIASLKLGSNIKHDVTDRSELFLWIISQRLDQQVNRVFMLQISSIVCVYLPDNLLVRHVEKVWLYFLRWVLLSLYDNPFPVHFDDRCWFQVYHFVVFHWFSNPVAKFLAVQRDNLLLLIESCLKLDWFELMVESGVMELDFNALRIYRLRIVWTKSTWSLTFDFRVLQRRVDRRINFQFGFCRWGLLPLNWVWRCLRFENWRMMMFKLCMKRR